VIEKKKYIRGFVKRQNPAYWEALGAERRVCIDTRVTQQTVNHNESLTD
jgi:hypothetical protein